MISSHQKTPFYFVLLRVLCGALLLVLSGFLVWQYVCIHQLKPVADGLEKTYKQEKEKLSQLKTQSKQLLPNQSRIEPAKVKKLKQENDALQKKLSGRAQEFEAQKNELQESIKLLEQVMMPLHTRYQTFLKQKKEKESINEKEEQIDIEAPEYLYEFSIIIDSKIHFYRKGNSFFVKLGDHDNEEKPRLTHYDTNQYEIKSYKDQFGALWKDGGACYYDVVKATNKAHLACSFTPGRHAYYICRSAIKRSDDEYDFGITYDKYGNEKIPPALLVFKNKKNNIYEGVITGVHGCPDAYNYNNKYIADNLSQFKLIDWSSSTGNAGGNTSKESSEEQSFTELCKKASVEYDPDLWKRMNELFVKDRPSLTTLQQELFPLARLYLGKFKEKSSCYYAKQLRLMLPDIMAGKDINFSNKNGNTALHYAAAMGSKKLCIWLVEHGAMINARNRNYQTPLDCLGVNKSGLDDWLISKGAVRSHPLSTEDVVLLENGSTGYTEERTVVFPNSSDVQELIKGLILRYLLALGGPDALGEGDMEALLACFAGQVDYFEEGVFSKEQIKKDNLVYFSTYPKRKFYLESMEMTDMGGGNYLVAANASCRLMNQAGKINNREMSYSFRVNVVENKPLITSIKSQKRD